MKINTLVPVKRILKQIDSCKTQKDINKCQILIENYMKSAKNVINYQDLFDRLDEELDKRQEEILLVKIFN